MGSGNVLAVMLFAVLFVVVVGCFFALPFVVGALLSHWLGWSMWVTTPIATVFLFSTGIMRIRVS